ncbi:PREDICTED: roundabout homolog 1-like [Acropora digitifera]|uniref:roundabout homolog 1-like n=1 Tax=Acropora digitifera TaxID=70779 RepID=UPI00077B1F81|nr:PREDICTED: roundabout homolog 1-like [Acropora digitifera]
MSFALYCMLFGILVFCPEKETATTEFLVTPSDPSHAIEGEDYSLEWTYTLDGGVGAVQFLNATGGGNDPIGARIGPGKVNSTQKYKARFMAQATNTRAELMILAVQLSDEGTYRLTLVSASGASITENVNVIVQYPPRNITTSSNQNITKPTNLTLNCSAVGKPKPTITWTFDKKIVTMPLYIIPGKNGKRKKEIYQCAADNGVGNSLAKNVTINIFFRPNVTLALKVFVDREQNASLKCEVEGNPTPTISWSPCDVGNHLCDKPYLNISKVQSARTNYTCTARNYLGTDSASILLLIGGKKVYLRLSVNGECDNQAYIWETLKKELDKVFANTTGYSGAQLIEVRCGSLIFDVVLKFKTKAAEDDTISLIQNAIVDGMLGELSVNVSDKIIGIAPVEQTTTAPPAGTTPKSDDDNTVVIICAVLGSVASIALIAFIIWYVRKKKCCSEGKEVSDGTNAGQGRKGKGPNGADEVAYASASMLPNSKRPVEKTNQSTVQALPMYAQVDKTKKTSNKGGNAQRQRQPGELNYAEVEHVTSGRSLPRKSSSEPIKLSNEEIVYADLV